MSDSHRHSKRETDLQIISGWVQTGQRVLDLGCGRGVLLEYLRQVRDAYAVGVDTDPEKIRACVKRGVPVFQGDAAQFLQAVPDGFYDWIIISRTLQELDDPETVLSAALRAGKSLAIGFANYGYWRNRLAHLVKGTRVRNVVYPKSWHEAPVVNAVSIHDFETFCRARHFRIREAVYLKGDWRRPQRFYPNLLAGYAVYWLERAAPETASPVVESKAAASG